MLTDKEFEDAFTAVGGKFFANTYELISEHIYQNTSDLVDTLYPLGFDEYRTGTSTRVSSSKRLIGDDSGIRALKKVARSNRIDKSAVNEAQKILKEKFNILSYED